MTLQERELLLPTKKELRQDRPTQFETLTDIASGSTDQLYQSSPLMSAASAPLQFMDLLPIPIVLVDRNNTIRFINKATGSICPNYRTVLGQDISHLFPRQQDCQGVKAFMENLLLCRHAQIREGEIQILSTKVNCRIFLSSTKIAEEEFSILVVENCALMQTAAILSEECRTLVNVVPAGVAHFELPTPLPVNVPYSTRTENILKARLKTANDQFAYMHGFTAVDELRGALAAEFVQPFSPMENAFRSWIDQGLPLYHTKLNSDSSDPLPPLIEVELAANIINQQVFSYWLVERSLAKRHKMQALFQALGGRFRTVFERVDDLILMKDRDSRYLEVNPAVKRTLGLDGGTIEGKTPEEVWGIESGRKIQACDAEALNGITTSHILSVRRNSHIKVHLTCTPMRDLEDNIIGLFEIGHLVHNPWPASKNSCMDSSHLQKDEFPVCRSFSMRKTLETAWVAARTEGTILLTGETGSGKDFLAHLIHKNSARSAKPFIVINCAAVTQELAESELFGHEPGAFTGAKKQKKGMLELAHGGTLLMNEVGELPLSVQAKLLTFLDTNTFCRVGGTKQISVDARILAATNRPLAEDITSGRFRQDLFYRLHVLSIVVPPLRERREDLPQMIKQILADFARRSEHYAVPQLSPALMSALLDYNWPGNVRELKSVLQRVLILSEAGEVTTKALGLDEGSREWAIKTEFPKDRSLNELLEDVKHALIEEALRRSGGKRQEAALLLGISRNSLKHHMRVGAERRNQPTFPA